MMNSYRWNDWKLDHTSIHGVTPDEVEMVIDLGHFRGQKEGRYLMWGRGHGGRLLQAAYVLDADGFTRYRIHARPLNEAEKRNFRKKYK